MCTLGAAAYNLVRWRIIAKLDRLTRSVVDLAELLKRFERRGVALVSVADALDTRSAAGRLVLNIMVSVSQREREAVGERARDALRHKRATGQRIGTPSLAVLTWQRAGCSSSPIVHEQDLLKRMRQAQGGGLDPATDCRRSERRRPVDAPGDRVAVSVCRGRVADVAGPRG